MEGTILSLLEILAGVAVIETVTGKVKKIKKDPRHEALGVRD